ncbi:MAG: translation initiation factor IF-2 [Candidatus Yanofskybacteria bacterium]|nr:translation initiation factor IF-2 [Candidatus Yanofskybacteria bacterium]
MANNSNNSGKNTRPPVVVVLGHVDHGKTKLLDTIRKTKVAEGESGGITQHIGAYQVEVSPSADSTGSPQAGSGPKMITFLDTPGHEAFTAIRSRGAKVADIAILVVAADESVKPQTKEAIRIIKEEKIPFIVALNKIDKEGANVQKVKQDLATEDVLVEDWGGKIPVVEISAKTNKNTDALLDMVLLVAELEELKEDLSSPAQGVIIESNLEKRRGYVATALVNKGILNVGDFIVVGTVVGKIKSMEDFMGKSIVQAGPSQPVLITGWPAAPDIGKEFVVAPDKDEAVGIAEKNVNLAPLFSFFKGSVETGDENKKFLNLVFKSDVSSSLEAIEASLKAIKSSEVGYRVISYDIGNISEADVKTAIASKCQVIGFRVGMEDSAKKLAEKEGIKISNFEIIYELIEHVRNEMGELLGAEIKKNPLGKLKVLATFKKSSGSQIFGGKVLSGKAVRGMMGDVVRNGVAVVSGKIGQLQHNKEDMPEVKEGLEAGIRFDAVTKDFPEVKVGDILDIYEEEKIARTL